MRQLGILSVLTNERMLSFIRAHNAFASHANRLNT